MDWLRSRVLVRNPVSRAIALQVGRRVGLALAATLPAACTMVAPPPPANPFVGTWATAEHQHIAFRDNTVVINPADAPPTAMSAASCSGTFRFGYVNRRRGDLLGLAARQPDLQQRLEALLPRADYRVAELVCGDGDSTYVLVDARDLVAIHRDNDIAGIEKLSRF